MEIVCVVGSCSYAELLELLELVALLLELDDVAEDELLLDEVAELLELDDVADDDDDELVTELLDVAEDDELVTLLDDEDDVWLDDVERLDDDDVALDDELLDTSSLVPPRKHRRCTSKAPAVKAAVVICSLMSLSVVRSTALDAVPSGVVSVRPSAASDVSARISFVAPESDSTLIPILPPPTSGSTTWTTPSNTIVPAGKVTPMLYHPTSPPSSANDQRAMISPSGFQTLWVAS